MSILRPRETHPELEHWKPNVILHDIKGQKGEHRLLDDGVEGMDDIEREVVETWQQSQRQNLRKKTCIAQTNAQCAEASSLTKIPPEVLTDIFMNLSPTEVLLPLSKQNDRYPWILGHVCAHWRNVLWTTSAIWKNIQIVHIYPAVSDNHHHNICEAFRHILSKTHTHISIYCSGLIIPSLDIIIAHNHRFKKLKIHTLNQRTLLRLTNLPNQSFANLEEFEGSWRFGTSAKKHSDRMSSFFETAPKLHSVSLTSTDKLYTPQLLFLPWERLTEAFMAGMAVPPSTIHATLQRCVALVKCEFLIGTGAFPATDITIALPALEKLELIAHQEHHRIFEFDWEGFIRPFFTPSLKYLRISALQFPPQPFTSLICRSKCALDTVILDITQHDADQSHYESFLGHLSTVTTFHALRRTTPASIIRKIYEGLLPLVEECNLFVHPDGLEACLDMVDSYISTNSKCRDSERRKVKLHIECSVGPGFEDVEDRYCRGFEAYQSHNWLNLTVINWITGLHMGD
jgi:hypothetical protein